MRGFFFCCILSEEAGERNQKDTKTSPQETTHIKMQKAELQPTKSMEGVGSLSFSGAGDDEELSRSALSTFRAKEEEIEKKRMEVRERFQAQLGRVEEESKRLAMIREELEAFGDPMRKDVSQVRKRIDTLDKELKPLGVTVQKKEREYKEALDAFNEKNKVKVQLINRLVELVGESEKMRLKKLEELSNSIETMRLRDLKSTLSMDN